MSTNATMVVLRCQHCGASFTAMQQSTPSSAACPKCAGANVLRARKTRGGPAIKPKNEATRSAASR